MDDEAKELLREIRNILEAASERDSAWMNEQRESASKATLSAKRAWGVTYLMYALVAALAGSLIYIRFFRDA